MFIHPLNGCSRLLIRFEVNCLREEDHAVVRIPIHDPFAEGLKVEPDIAEASSALQKKYILVRNTWDSFWKIIYAVTPPDVYSMLAKELFTAGINNEISNICVERVIDKDTSLIFVKVVEHFIELLF